MQNTVLSYELQNAIGKIEYSLTNDYMFHAVLQTNELVLKGLISSLLHLPFENINSVNITNPIKLGESINSKEYILDINVMLNNDTIINLEMQVNDLGNWENRSLSYLSRSFDQLVRGSDYDAIHPVIHIGILDYTLFDDAPEFYAKNMLMNTKNHKVFNDKFVLNVLCLNQIRLATDEDKKWQIDKWATLFKARTWEEIRMVSENNEIFTSAAESLYRLAADNMIREQCRAREDYEAHERNIQRKLEEKDREIAELKRKLLEKM